jgi:formamidopyrimidine-DNA glycosylase
MAVKQPSLKKLYSALKEVLRGGIEFGGDSMSDYRNIFGERGHYQEKHRAYQKKGERCEKRRCDGIIERKIVGGRSSHFCPKHQKLLK